MTFEEFINVYTLSDAMGGRSLKLSLNGVPSSAADFLTTNDAVNGGRAIKATISGGGTVGTGFLQIAGGVPLDTTLRTVTDNSATPVSSPLQLSTTNIAVQAAGVAGLIMDQDTSSAPLSSRLFFRNASTTFAIGSSSTDLNFRYGSVLGSSSGTLQMKMNSTGLGVGGDFTLSARLHVRGDGTNPIARFENSSGGNAWYFTSAGGALNAEGQANIQGPSIGNDFSLRLASYNTLSTTSGSQGVLGVVGTFGSAAGSGNKRLTSFEYTINNSGAQSGTATGIFLNATETALNGMTHNLMDLQVGGVSKIRGTNAGALVLASGLTAVDNILTSGGDIQASGVSAEVKFGSRIRLSASADGVMLIRNNGGTDFGRLMFGGSTNAYCALKRNTTTLEVKLADDSAFTFIKGKITTETNYTAGAIVATGYLTLYDASGTAYRVPCVV